jgi:dUTP pyrophosphatase
MIVEFQRVDQYAKIPTRSNPSDAGLDVYAHIEDPVTIEPGGSVLIKTGLRFGVPHGYMLQVMNRSSVAAKRSLVVGAHVIDSGYDGEVFINLHNIGTKPQTVYYGDKIAQLVESKLYRHPITISDRGDGALGSTGG